MRRGQRLRQGGFIYLRTGGNGSCKTLFTLADVRKLQLETGRPVCINLRPADDPKEPNKPYCRVYPEKMAEFGWTAARFKDWQDQPDGTIFLVDECHYDLPVRTGSSAQVPPHVAKLSEHRSRGFDFFMLTQHPQNVDVFVRRLVQAPGWHQHLKRIFGASNATRVLQWDAVNAQCEKDGSGESAQITTRTQPKEVFQWYDSAFIHTGRKRIPFQVWLIVACVPLVLALVLYTWYAFTRNQDKTKERITGDVATANSTADGRP
ncbi:zonular occludens toxin domain-containing protein, partial [Pseudacidovorax intermedius]